MLRRLRGWTAAAALAVVAAAGAPASALTLADVVADGGFVSANGSLVFSDFEVTLADPSDLDLASVTVAIAPEGFKLMFDDLSVFDGEAVDFLISYTVTPAAGYQFDAAYLWFQGGSASGQGSMVNVTEDLLVNGALLGDMFVFKTGGGASRGEDETHFAPTVASLSVLKDIQLIALADGSASVDVIGQHYNVTLIPEPGTLALVGSGIAGLLIAGRRRRV